MFHIALYQCIPRCVQPQESYVTKTELGRNRLSLAAFTTPNVLQTATDTFSKYHKQKKN